MDKVKCKCCDGTGRMKVTVQTGIGPGARRTDHSIGCVECKGTGALTKKRVAELEAQEKLWCVCGNPSGAVKYYDDGEHPECDKHHWRCSDCGKILQIG